jgi:dTDP-4-amino-4,6-dideoxygalactose transaminase
MKIEVYSPTIRRKEMDAVLTAMVEEKIGPGERCRFLIQTIKEQLRFDYALSLRSPAVALHFALKALNAKPGQAVIISALSPRYYVRVLEDLQLTPLFCDVSLDFPCISSGGIEKLADGSDVCAVALHHTLGFMPGTSAILELGIPVIEDISQSYGSWFLAEHEKDQTPLKGRLFILGLEERDMLTSGGGALLFAMNRGDGSLLRNFSNLPDEYCLPDINAALAIAQFREIFRNLQKRSEIARIYSQSSLRTRHKRFVPLTDYNNYSFPLVLEAGLKDVVAYAKKKEIAVESAFGSTAAQLCKDCPAGNSLALRTVIFPMYPGLHSAEVERVSKLIMTLP